MSTTKRAKRANPPVCWECGRKLHMGGWQYATIVEHDGYERPVHRDCLVEACRHIDLRDPPRTEVSR